jgi:hypothetical protein
MNESRTGIDPMRGIGCLSLVVVFLICVTAGAIFDSAGPDGVVWASVAVAALSAMGLGIVYALAKYRS